MRGGGSRVKEIPSLIATAGRTPHPVYPWQPSCGMTVERKESLVPVSHVRRFLISIWQLTSICRCFARVLISAERRSNETIRFPHRTLKDREDTDSAP